MTPLMLHVLTSQIVLFVLSASAMPRQHEQQQQHQQQHDSQFIVPPPVVRKDAYSRGGDHAGPSATSDQAAVDSDCPPTSSEDIAPDMDPTDDLGEDEDELERRAESSRTRRTES